MNGIIDADTHISEGEAMWKMLEPDFLPRRPIMLKVPSDTWYGNRDAFWLIDGEIYPKPQVRGVSPWSRRRRKASRPAAEILLSARAK